MKQCTWRQKQREKSCCNEISGESRILIAGRPALKDGKTDGAIAGWAFGASLYFSYLFLLVWIAVVVYWWLRPERYETWTTLLEYGIRG